MCAFLGWFRFGFQSQSVRLLLPTAQPENTGALRNHIFCVRFVEVREECNKVIADLVAWSLKHAASGLGPTRGVESGASCGRGACKRLSGGLLLLQG